MARQMYGWGENAKFMASDLGRLAAQHSRRRLSRLLLAYVTLVVVLATLAPFEFQWPEHARLSLHVSLFDSCANVAMFFPVGFFAGWVISNREEVPKARIVVMGAFLSACIECVQVFEPLRYPSPLDVAMNSLGAFSGALLFEHLSRAVLDEDRVIATLDLPLLGSAYALLPLLLTAHPRSPSCIAPELIFPLTTAVLSIWSVCRYRIGRSGTERDWRRAPRWALLWAFVVVAIASASGFSLAQATVAMLVSIGLSFVLLPRLPASERRFEVPTLRRTIILFACYLASSVLLPPKPMGLERAAFHLGPFGATFSKEEVLALLERLSAMFVFAYMLAELGGRSLRSDKRLLALSAAGATVVSLLLEASRAVRGEGASAAGLGLDVAAAIAGSLLYLRYRDYVEARMEGQARPLVSKRARDFLGRRQA